MVESWFASGDAFISIALVHGSEKPVGRAGTRSQGTTEVLDTLHNGLCLGQWIHSRCGVQALGLEGIGWRETPTRDQKGLLVPRQPDLWDLPQHPGPHSSWAVQQLAAPYLNRNGILERHP